MIQTSLDGVLIAVVLACGCTQNPPEPLDRIPTERTDNIGTPPTDQARRFESQQHPPASVIFIEYVVTPHDVVSQMLKLAEVRRDDVLYDLGCGDGRILVAAAKKYGCRAVGVDLDRLRVRETKANAFKNNVADRITVEQKDVLAVDLRPATVVTLYLGRELNHKLVPQLEQLRPGARIVSHNFGIEGFPPDKVVRMTSREDHEEHLIYLWVCPLRRPDVDG